MLSALSSVAFKMPGTVEAALQHFAGGVVLSATSTELVPVIMEKQASIPAVTIGFFSGVGMLILIRSTLGHGHGGGGEEEEGEGHGHGHGQGNGGHDDHGGGHGGGGHKGHDGHAEEAGDGYKKLKDGKEAGKLPYSSLLATLVDFMCDGMLMGLSFSAGATAGMILVVSIALEMASVGAAVFSGMKNARVPTVKGLAVMAGLGAALFLSGIAAFSMADSIKGTTGYYVALSFGIAACLWLACEDLLSEAHEGGEEKSWVTAMFFVGFLLPILLDKMQGDE
mmetsp:Transcript_94146/g.302979  ORF Transcript_94146/g.302979 Transcript_94146/m.302979 type:complete len:281 (+) Transcript_94146:94-936(+)